MEEQVDKFAGLIAMIKKASIEKDDKEIGVYEYYGEFVYGEMKGGFIVKPFKLGITDKDNICQNLYDCLINEFGEQLTPYFSRSFGGSYGYYMSLGDNVSISFPEGEEYNNWIYQQVQKDNEKYREEKGTSR